MFALFENGVKIKEARNLPTHDGSMPVMAPGFEWLEIEEDIPAYDPVYQQVTVSESKNGKKLNKTKTVSDNPDWQAAARAFVAQKLRAYTTWDLLWRDILEGENGPNKARALAAVAHADALVAQIDAGQKPDLGAGWPE